MFWNVFAAKPFAALSVIICLGTIASCISLKRRYMPHVADRFLVGFVGLLAIIQGFRIVQHLGLLSLPSNGGMGADVVDLVITLLYFQAPMVLRLSSYDRLSTDFELRLARAAPPKNVPLLPEKKEMPRADTTTLDGLKSALETLTPQEFKIYACLWLRSQQSSTREGREQNAEMEIREQLVRLAANVGKDAVPAKMPPHNEAVPAMRTTP